jgi:hypothetical protein
MKLYQFSDKKTFAPEFQGNETMQKSFCPGDVAPESGIYMVIHSLDCQMSHSVTVLWGETFPACGECGDEVRFESAISAIHVREHDLFVDHH